MPSILSYYKLNEDRGCLVQIVPSTCLADNENLLYHHHNSRYNLLSTFLIVSIYKTKPGFFLILTAPWLLFFPALLEYS